MTQIYLDSVFLLNGAMDYLLLLLTARLAGIPLRRRRYLWAALAGGVYAAAVFWPGLGFLAETPVKIAAGVLMAVAAFGGEQRLARLTLLLFAVSCGMAGCVLGLGLLAGEVIPVQRGIFYTDVNLRVLLLSAAAAYGVLTLVFRSAARHGLQGRLLRVRVCIGGAETELTALWDSGNGLREPETGRPVLVAAPETLAGILPEEVSRLLTAWKLKAPAELVEPLMEAVPALRPRLLPYRAVGTEGGLLLTLQTDWLEIGGKRYLRGRVALSPTELGVGYGALWGGETGKGGRYGNNREVFAADPAFSGAAAAGERSLHRRQ